MLLRYPGSKDAQLRSLAAHIERQMAHCGGICEPFAGTGAVTFDILSRVSGMRSVWLNDTDPGIAALWQVIGSPAVADLIALIKPYVPRAPDFFEFKENPGRTDMDRAFRKLVLHQISPWGLGAAAGGPMGGRNQTGPFLVGSRWDSKRLVQRVKLCADLLRNVDVRVTSMDFAEVLRIAFAENRFVYLDPPYFRQGQSLYLRGSIDHVLLANMLREHEAQEWLLSYDAAPEIRALYDWADVTELPVRSRIHHRVISDLVILPRVSQQLRIVA